MEELELKYKKELIESLLHVAKYNPYVFYIPGKFWKEVNETDEDYLNKRTFDELVHFILLSQSRDYDKCWRPVLKNLYRRATFMKTDVLNKKIDKVQNSIHTTEDVINLFTDIDKNRINQEEHNNKVNSRLDKLETSIEQILVLLQKS